MQKLKKALKKLANFAPSKSAHGPAQAAKKATPVKKKSQPVAASGSGAKAVAKKPAPAKKVLAKTATKPAASKPHPKSDSKHDAKHAAKDMKKKQATPAPAVKKTADKAPAKAPEKSAKKPAETPAAGAKAQASVKPEVKVDAAKAAQAKAGKKRPEAPIVKAEPAKSETGKVESVQVGATAAAGADEEIILTDADGRRYCRVKDCDQASTVDGYCRYHYLLFWKNIQNRKKILSEGKLERYIEELTARYPDKYLELLRKDLRSEKDFTAAIQELEIDDTSGENEFEDEAQSFIDEVRGMSSEAGTEREEDF